MKFNGRDETSFRQLILGMIYILAVFSLLLYITCFAQPIKTKYKIYLLVILNKVVITKKYSKKIKPLKTSKIESLEQGLKKQKNMDSNKQPFVEQDSQVL